MSPAAVPCPLQALFRYLEVLEEPRRHRAQSSSLEEQSVSVYLSGKAVCQGEMGAEAGTPGCLQVLEEPAPGQVTLLSQPLLQVSLWLVPYPMFLRAGALPR